VDRADDVACQLAGTLQHDRLTVPADVGQLPESAVVVVEQLAVILPFERAVIAGRRHHELVTDITGAGFEEVLLLQRKNLRIEIPVHRQLGNCGGQAGQCRNVGHTTPPTGERQDLGKKMRGDCTLPDI
jgi:hypothetical protein